MKLDLVQTIATARMPLALATILDVKGSAPRHPGSKMLVTPEGSFTGSVGGGQAEARALAACRECLADGRPVLLHIEMLGETILGTDMVCGGTSIMLVEPLAEPELYRRIQDRLESGERILLIKRIRQEPGSFAVDTALVDETGVQIAGDFRAWEADAAARAFATGKARFDEDSGVFYDPLLPEEKLVILGAGHVGHALALAAVPLGFRITVVDDRAEFLGPDRFPPEVATVQGDFIQVIAELPFDTSTYAVIVTRGHRFDLTCVRAVLTRKFRYAGLMGSARKTRMLIEQLHQEGFDPARIDALFTPVGLSIGAETPAELAVAILGEIVAVRRNSATVAVLKQAHATRRAAVAVREPALEGVSEGEG